MCALQGLKTLAAAASLDKLQHLDLCHNDLGGAAAAEGLQQLVAGAGQLQSLKLRNTAIKGTGRAPLVCVYAFTHSPADVSFQLPVCHMA
jgi:X-X-X-Leu-X-X-Gly heptad repeat protein